MKKIALLAAVSQLALTAGGGSANAADLRLKAPPMVAPPAYSWTGCYVGGHVGYGWGRHDVTDSNFSLGGARPIAVTNRLDSSGGLYGVQAGCNYQFAGNWVVGIQGDIAGADIRGTVADPYASFNVGPGNDGTLGMKTNWIASVTGRLGITAWNNQALFYVKGGAAWTQSKWDLSQSSYCRAYGCTDPSLDDRRTGWTIGGGVEWVIWPSWSNWTAFAEYNYYGFGDDGSRFEVGRVVQDPRNAISPARENIQTVKVGLNYKLYHP